MSDTYVTLKIREALQAAGGSRGQAQRILLTMALDDEQLLRGLTKPFLKAIVGSAVERVARGQGAAPAAPAARPTAARGRPGQRKALTPQALEAIVRNIGTPGATLPMGQPPEPDDRGEQAHALKTLADAFRAKKP